MTTTTTTTYISATASPQTPISDLSNGVTSNQSKADFRMDGLRDGAGPKMLSVKLSISSSSVFDGLGRTFLMKGKAKELRQLSIVNSVELFFPFDDYPTWETETGKRKTEQKSNCEFCIIVLAVWIYFWRSCFDPDSVLVSKFHTHRSNLSIPGWSLHLECWGTCWSSWRWCRRAPSSRRPTPSSPASPPQTCS